MQRMNRRAVLVGLALLPALDGACAAEGEQLSIEADEGNIAVTRYAADGTGKRPAVLVLHGLRGIEIKPAAYMRYANALTAAGIDAYLVRYLTSSDLVTLDPKTSTKETREPYETARFDAWAKRISAVTTAVLARPETSGRIGLLGFSLGGFVAAATAARDERVAALAVLYGGLPDAMASEVKHLPPLLELHGEADANVPLRDGEELVRLGKRLGAEAELVTYPGRKHGFDFSDTDPATSDAIGRVMRFFEGHLARG